MTRRVRVLLDARMLIGRFAGVSRFVTALVDELARAPDIRLIALCGAECPSAWAGRNDIEALRTDFARPDRTPFRRLRWEQKRLPNLIRRCRADVFHATWNSGIPGRCPVPAILTIHDLIPWHAPDAHFTSSFQRHCYQYTTRASVRRAAFVTTVSEYVRRDVLETLPARPDRTVAIPNGVVIPGSTNEDADPARYGNETRPESVNQPDKPYALYVGGHEERKNVAGVFTSLTEYWQRFGPTLSLHVTGTPASLSPSAAKVYHSLPRKDLVYFLGQPDDRRLAKEYASAALLITLSRAEGFGLPALEAMAYGCPVVAAASASLPEVVGDAGLLVDPCDLLAVTDAIQRLRTDLATRRECIARGRDRARAFTWQATANRYRGLYLRTARRPPASSEAPHVSPLPTRQPVHP